MPQAIEQYSVGTITQSPNKLLATLPHADFARIAPALRAVPMKMKHRFHKQEERISEILFPGGGACSLVKTLEDGQSAEVATVGCEGAVGASVFFGQPEAAADVIVQVPAHSAQMMPVEVFIAEMNRHGAFFNHVIRYNQALMSQVMQTTVCNGLHSAQERCCRWLLMTRDRAGADQFPLTHESLAAMLAVRRPTVTIVLAALEREGLISHSRGLIAIVDRSGLEGVSCECYRTVRSTFRKLLPEVGETAFG